VDLMARTIGTYRTAGGGEVTVTSDFMDGNSWKCSGCSAGGRENVWAGIGGDRLGTEEGARQAGRQHAEGCHVVPHALRT
jgi:hypothetical protein